LRTQTADARNVSKTSKKHVDGVEANSQQILISSAVNKQYECGLDPTVHEVELRCDGKCPPGSSTLRFAVDVSESSLRIRKRIHEASKEGKMGANIPLSLCECLLISRRVEESASTGVQMVMEKELKGKRWRGRGRKLLGGGQGIYGGNTSTLREKRGLAHFFLACSDGCLN
jgi:hypothetical protein